MKEIYYAEIDSGNDNYIRLIKVDEVEDFTKTTYVYDLNLSKWIQRDYLIEFKFDKAIYDEVSKEIAYTLINRWEKNI